MIRSATIEDLKGIIELYNQAVDAGFQTAYTTHFQTEERVNWFSKYSEHTYPLFVYEQDGIVAGWLSVSAYRPGRAALQYAVEVSYFVHKDYQRRGIGSQLMAHGIAACRRLNYKTVLAIILEPNNGSAKLLEKFGFEKWAYLPDIAEFGEVACSQIYYGLKTG